MKMKRSILVPIGAALALGFLAVGGSNAEVDDKAFPSSHTTPPKGLHLDGGATSVEELLGAFLAALEKENLGALNALRVTRDEYRKILLPGTIEKGEPPREFTERQKRYFWDMLDFKSREFAKVLARRFAGRTYRDYELRFSAAPQRYAWYTAYGEVRMKLEGEDGRIDELMTGWIAEVNGRYKFIGFEWDG